MSTSVIYVNKNLNAYFDMKRFEDSIYRKTFVREERIKTRKKLKIFDNILTFIALIFTITLLIVAGFIAYSQIRISRLDYEILRLETELESMRKSTELKTQALKSEVKYDNLKMKAYLDLNMITPTEKNIIYFDKSNKGYVRQYENIR